jgi:transcriptional regulator with XRE-family HTH domain
MQLADLAKIAKIAMVSDLRWVWVRREVARVENPTVETLDKLAQALDILLWDCSLFLKLQTDASRAEERTNTT